MSAESYVRRRWTYSFRAWIDERGSNRDREHRAQEGRCVKMGCGRAPELCGHEPFPCRHLRLWDVSMTRSGANVVRTVRRGGYLRVMVGPRCRTVFGWGRA